MSSSPRLHYPQETNSRSSAYNGAVSMPQQIRAGMRDIWKQWEGRVVDGVFPLQRFLGGSDRSAVFLTQYGQGVAQRAVIKLVLVDPNTADAQLFRWRLATKLPSPGLIRIFTMGESKLDATELLYLVMECADEDLAQILPERSLTPQETQDMLLPVLETLAYVHSQGFIHGNVSPSNIVAVADCVKMSSDSLCALQEAAKCERGVSRYAAPEVAQGSISTASDVWSLGMTLVEVLTQRLPAADPARPGAVVLPDGMPEPFLGVAKQCLQSDPLQRCTIADVAAQLKPVPAATRVRETLAPAAHKRQFLARWLMAAVAAGLVALLWKSSWTKRTSNPPDRPAQVGSSQGQSGGAIQSVLPKPSPGAPAGNQAGETREPTASTAAAPMAATVPSGTAPKSEAAPDLNGSTATGPKVLGVVHAVMPEVSRSARNTIEGKVRVRVRVQVDASGNVVSAKLDSHGPSKYFARLALEAAQGWKFTPVQAQGQYVASEWALRFVFSRSDTVVVPKQITP
jgi:TonB family protein